MIRKQFDNTQCDTLAALASTKDHDAVLDNAAGFFGDGTANEAADVMSKVYENVATNYPTKIPIWSFYFGETKVYYIGKFKDVHTLIASLP